MPPPECYDAVVTAADPGTSGLDQDRLRALAAKYIWWQDPDQAIRRPQRVIAQVMNLGDFEDVQDLVAEAGHAALVETLRRAEAGQFNARSWHYWHYRLGLAQLGTVPPLPSRTFS